MVDILRGLIGVILFVLVEAESQATEVMNLLQNETINTGTREIVELKIPITITDGKMIFKDTIPGIEKLLTRTEVEVGPEGELIFDEDDPNLESIIAEIMDIMSTYHPPNEEITTEKIEEQSESFVITDPMTGEEITLDESIPGFGALIKKIDESSDGETITVNANDREVKVFLKQYMNIELDDDPNAQYQIRIHMKRKQTKTQVTDEKLFFEINMTSTTPRDIIGADRAAWKTSTTPRDIIGADREAWKPVTTTHPPDQFRSTFRSHTHRRNRLNWNHREKVTGMKPNTHPSLEMNWESREKIYGQYGNDYGDMSYYRYFDRYMG